MNPLPEPANLRFLRRLVTVLTAVMILGVLTIVALLVIRLNSGTAPIALPGAIALPDGARAVGVTHTPSHILVVTEGGDVLVFDPTGTTLRQTIQLD